MLSAFELAQGYLHLSMTENDIKKTAFRAGSSVLYEFTLMPFGLSDAQLNFFGLMELCLGHQQSVTLLLYLDDVCVLTPDINQHHVRLDQVHF